MRASTDCGQGSVECHYSKTVQQYILSMVKSYVGRHVEKAWCMNSNCRYSSYNSQELRSLKSMNLCLKQLHWAIRLSLTSSIRSEMESSFSKNVSHKGPRYFPYDAEFLLHYMSATSLILVMDRWHNYNYIIALTLLLPSSLPDCNTFRILHKLERIEPYQQYVVER